MRRRKAAVNSNTSETGETTNHKCSKSTKTEDQKTDEMPVIKSEPIDPKDSPVKDEDKRSSPNLTQFKFEKKPHIKIEFDNDSPTKNDVKGTWEPPHWQQFLVNLRIMRANCDAPVDSMGCHKAMDMEASPAVKRYHSLIALMLSSQTKDQVTFAAMERLKEKGLTVENVLSWSDDELGKLIYPVGFWKTKIKFLKKTSQILKEQYNCDIPDSVDKLCKLPGVGPKMAHICMSVAWNKITGIGVDTHVHRISNRIGWVKKPTTVPEETRKALESWLPFDLWHEVNHLMVGFGQTICQPISPICNECLNRDICPSSGKGRKTPNKKSPVKEESNLMDSKQELTDIKPNLKKVTPNKAIKVTKDSKNTDDFEPSDLDKKRNNKSKTKLPTLQLDVKEESIDLKENSEAVKKTRKASKKKQSDESNNERNTDEAKMILLEVDTAKSSLKRRSPRNKGDNVVKDIIKAEKKRSRK